MRTLIKGPPGTRRFLAVWAPDRAADAAVDAMLGFAAAASTESPLGAGGVMAIAFLPQLVMMFVGGVTGDRVGPLRLAKVTLAVRIVLLGLLALTMTATHAWVWVAGIGALLGVLDAFHFPALEGVATLLGGEGDKVGQGQLQGAMVSTGRLAGLVAAPAAGALLGFGHGVPLAVIAGLLLISWVAIAGLGPRVRSQAPTDDDEASDTAWQSAVEGLRCARRIPQMGWMLGIFAAGNMLTTPAVMLGIALLAQERRWAGLEYGLVFGSFAVGTAIGGALLNRYRDRVTRSIQAALFANVVGATGLAVMMLSPAWIATLGGLLAGCACSAGAGLLRGDIRAATPSRFASRIGALIATSIYGLIPVGYVVFSLLAEPLGVAGAGTIMCAALVIVSVAGLIRLPTSASEPIKT